MNFKTTLHKALTHADFVMVDGIDMEDLRGDRIRLEDDSVVVAPDQDIDINATGFAWFDDQDGHRHEMTLRMYRPFNQTDLEV